jgi:hypothetical protein
MMRTRVLVKNGVERFTRGVRCAYGGIFGECGLTPCRSGLVLGSPGIATPAEFSVAVSLGVAEGAYLE